jgi:hypothetical protein
LSAALAFCNPKNDLEVAKLAVSSTLESL